MIILDIDFSAIPKDRLTEAKNGHLYGKVCLVEMKQPDNWGNTHTLYMQQTKEEREARADRIYIGKAREYKEQRHQPDLPITRGNTKKDRLF